MKPRLYNRNMQLVAVLENATQISYTKKYNDFYTCSFKMPIEDPKTALCETHFIVDIFDGNKNIGKFRIIEQPESQIGQNGSYVSFSCQHVIAFLLNDVIDGYLQIGGSGFTTPMVINTLLEKQSVKRWKLGTCHPYYQFQYSWQNTNVCDALFSVTGCFESPYHWEYDTSSYPWTINLISQSQQPSCVIVRKRNMTSMKRSKDSTQLCTRLYCKGNGEGVNQLDIKQVNNGLPYIDASTISQYGIMSAHFIDTTINDASTLLAKGKQVLEMYCRPRYTYNVKAVDLSRITGNSIDSFDQGLYVRVIDKQKNNNIDARIVQVTKNDVDGDPLDIDVTISNKSSDTADTIEQLARRTAISSQYSQGATNLYCTQFADNADQSNGAVLKFYVPETCARINKVLLNWDCQNFRAYSKATSSSQKWDSTSQADQGIVTTLSGGQASVSVRPQLDVSVQITSPVTGGSYNVYTSESGAHAHTWSDSFDWGHTHSVSQGAPSTGGVSNYSTKYVGGNTSNDGSHSHEFNHSHNAIVNVNGYDVTVQIPQHRHDLQLQPHTHKFQMPAHSHGIAYGIFKGSKASMCTMKIDGAIVGTSGNSGKDIDIVQHLAKDSSGKITRGTWHTIQILPNTMSRVVASLFVQAFVTSYEGGNY